jgi:hypothetical protein
VKSFEALKGMLIPWSLSLLLLPSNPEVNRIPPPIIPTMISYVTTGPKQQGQAVRDLNL